MRKPLAIAVSLAAVFASACGSSDKSSSPPRPGTSVEIRIHGGKFDPPNATVKVGGTIRFKNEDEGPETVASRGCPSDNCFQLGPLGKGDIAEAKLIKPEKITYFSTFHPDMTGTVTVVK